VNNTTHKTDKCPEKRTQENFLVCLVDKRGRTIWNSNDPLDSEDASGKAIVDTVLPADRETVLDALSRCFFKDETVDYEVTGEPPPASDQQRLTAWRVRLLPITNLTMIAGCCVCQALPEYHAEITPDERKMMALLCEDNTLKEIAQAMFLSESAIDNKMRGLKDKLGVKNIGGLVATAMREALI
jgi:DNA-binding CsgD family transcriptional regulator